MNVRVLFITSLLLTGIAFGMNLNGLHAEETKKKEKFTLPKQIVSLEKSNTFPNTSEDFEVIEPSPSSKELLDELRIQVDNPEFIKMLNETMINPSPIALGYRANIYLGRWPLHYLSENTSVIWDYQEINQNELNNSPGETVQELRYIQQEEREVKGALTSKIDHSEVIKKMMIQKAIQKTNLPLSFTTKIGKNTKLNHQYHVPVNKVGNLYTYAPAINEKGQVTYGEVYILLKGPSKQLEIKNVTKQGIGAWIPIQDHVALSFQLK